MITNVTFTLRGTTYTLTESNGTWSANITAPDESSWYEPNHEFVGTVHVDSADDLGLTYSTEQSAGLRVLETVKPVVTLIQPDEDWRFNWTGTPKLVWKVTDFSSGVTTTSLKIDGVEQGGVVMTPISTTDYLCEWQGEVAEGQHTATLTATDHDGNVSDEVSVIFGVFKLIWDRTNADVERVKTLARQIQQGAATQEEVAEWLANLKGSYNASDMNRVAWAEYFIEQLCKHYGYDIRVVAKRDWVYADIVTPSTEGDYIDDITTIRTLPHEPDTPNAPTTLEHLGYQTANDIEKILRDVQIVMTRSKLSWFASGEISCGE